MSDLDRLKRHTAEAVMLEKARARALGIPPLSPPRDRKNGAVSARGRQVDG